MKQNEQTALKEIKDLLIKYLKKSDKNQEYSYVTKQIVDKKHVLANAKNENIILQS